MQVLKIVLTFGGTILPPVHLHFSSFLQATYLASNSFFFSISYSGVEIRWGILKVPDTGTWLLVNSGRYFCVPLLLARYWTTLPCSTRKYPRIEWYLYNICSSIFPIPEHSSSVVFAAISGGGFQSTLLNEWFNPHEMHENSLNSTKWWACWRNFISSGVDCKKQ